MFYAWFYWQVKCSNIDELKDNTMIIITSTAMFNTIIYLARISSLDTLGG